jgi:hypothetical protein
VEAVAARARRGEISTGHAADWASERLAMAMEYADLDVSILQALHELRGERGPDLFLDYGGETVE